MKQPPYARCAPNASIKEIATNWNRSNRPAPVWDKLTADEQRNIIHSTRYPYASGSTPVPLRSEQDAARAQKNKHNSAS